MLLCSLFAKTSVWLHKFKSEVRQYQFVERLIDPNNKQLPVSISFRLSYLPPDSHVVDVAAVDLPADGLSGDPDKASSQHPWKLDQFKTVSYGTILCIIETLLIRVHYYGTVVLLYIVIYLKQIDKYSRCRTDTVYVCVFYL